LTSFIQTERNHHSKDAKPKESSFWQKKKKFNCDVTSPIISFQTDIGSVTRLFFLSRISFTSADEK
jgi:hypothetical protein